MGCYILIAPQKKKIYTIKILFLVFFLRKRVKKQSAPSLQINPLIKNVDIIIPFFISVIKIIHSITSN